MRAREDCKEFGPFRLFPAERRLLKGETPDPLEANNLIFAPGHEAIVQRMNKQLFDVLEATGGMSMPLSRDAGDVQRLRRPDRAKAAEFPSQLLKKPAAPQ